MKRIVTIFIAMMLVLMNINMPVMADADTDEYHPTNYPLAEQGKTYTVTLRDSGYAEDFDKMYRFAGQEGAVYTVTFEYVSGDGAAMVGHDVYDEEAAHYSTMGGALPGTNPIGRKRTIEYEDGETTEIVDKATVDEDMFGIYDYDMLTFMLFNPDAKYDDEGDYGNTGEGTEVEPCEVTIKFRVDLKSAAPDQPDYPDQPDIPEPHKFKLRRDNCSFVNSSSKSFSNSGFIGIKTGRFDTKYLSALEAKLSAKDRKTLYEQIDAGWGGSCAGISGTMGLVFNGVLNVSDISEKGKHSGTYFSMDYPSKNRKLFNNIQYCNYAMQSGMSEAGHIAQYENINYQKYMANFYSGEDLDKYDKQLFLEAMVVAAKNASSEGKILVFNLEYKKGFTIIAHSIVATDYYYDSGRQKHVIKLYDCNFANEYRTTEMVIEKDYSNADITVEAGTLTTRTVSTHPKVMKLDLYDPDRIDYYGKSSRGTKKTMNLSSADTDNTAVIEFPAGSNFSIYNSKGEYISINKGSEDNEDGYPEGNLEIFDVEHVAKGNRAYIALTVDALETYTIESIDSMYDANESVEPLMVNDKIAVADISILSNDHFSSVTTTNVDSIKLEPTGAITISPLSQNSDKTYDFKAFLSLESGDDACLNISGDASSDMTITPSGDQVTINSDEMGIDRTECFANCRTDAVDAENAQSGEIVINAAETVEYLNSITTFPIDEEYIEVADEGLAYNGRPCEPVVNIDGLTEGSDYEVEYKNNINAGKGQIIITGIGEYAGTVTKSFAISKAANTLSAAGKTATLKAKKLKKKPQKLTAAKTIAVSKAQGAVTYKLAGVTKAKFKKYFKVNTSTGKITVKKGLKKGKYKVKVDVTAAGNSNYNAAKRQVIVTIKVK